MSFVPDYFDKFGRSSNNLLNEHFDHGKDDFRTQASVRTFAQGVTVRSTAVSMDDDHMVAKVDAMHVGREYGRSRLELSTAGRFKASMNLDKISRGFALIPELTYIGDAAGNVSLSSTNTAAALGGANLTPSAAAAENSSFLPITLPTVKVTARLVKPGFAGSTYYNTRHNDFGVNVAYAMAEGVSIGGSLTTYISPILKGAVTATLPSFSKVFSPEVGLQYEADQMVGTLLFNAVKKQGTFNLYHRVSRTCQLASKYQTTPTHNIFAVGVNYKLATYITLKAKATMLNTGQYSLYGWAQWRQGNPNVWTSVSCTYNNDHTATAGIQMRFGEGVGPTDAMYQEDTFNNW